MLMKGIPVSVARCLKTNYNFQFSTNLSIATPFPLKSRRGTPEKCWRHFNQIRDERRMMRVTPTGEEAHVIIRVISIIIITLSSQGVIILQNSGGGVLNRDPQRHHRWKFYGHAILLQILKFDSGS